MALESLSSFSSTGTVSGTNTVNNTQKINTVVIGTGDITIDATKIPFSTSDSTNVNEKITSVDTSAVHKGGVETITGTKTFTSSTNFSNGIRIECDDGTSYDIRHGGNDGNELIIISNGAQSNGNNTILTVNANSVKIGSAAHSPVELGYTVEDTSNSNEVATTKWVNSNNYMPVGTVIAYAGKTTPTNYLFCDGSAISRTDYKELFDVIGTDYGTGDGSTTFNLPNLNDKFIQGNITPAIKRDSSIPTHYHGFGLNNNDNGGTFVAVNNAEKLELKQNSGIRGWNGSGGGGGYGGDIPTADCNMITTIEKYTSDLVVQPPALTMRYCIKYK